MRVGLGGEGKDSKWFHRKISLGIWVNRRQQMFLLKAWLSALLKFMWPQIVFHRMLCTFHRISMFQAHCWGKDELELSDKSIFWRVECHTGIWVLLRCRIQHCVDDTDAIWTENWNHGLIRPWTSILNDQAAGKKVWLHLRTQTRCPLLTLGIQISRWYGHCRGILETISAVTGELSDKVSACQSPLCSIS